MSYQDKNLPCRDCGRFFVFSAHEQGLCGELGHAQPGRCRACRQSREDARRNFRGDGDRLRSPMFLNGTVAGLSSDQRSLLSPQAAFSLSS